MLNTARRKWRLSESRGSTSGGMQPDANEGLREILFRLAYKQLAEGEWRRLAHHWAFTGEQIKAIEHQYTGMRCLESLMRPPCCLTLTSRHWTLLMCTAKINIISSYLYNI
jgi:hypothetical protein